MRIYLRKTYNDITSMNGGYTLAPYEIVLVKSSTGTHKGNRTLKLQLKAKKEGIPSRAHCDLQDISRKSFISDCGVSNVERLVGREILGIVSPDRNLIVGVALNI